MMLENQLLKRNGCLRRGACGLPWQLGQAPPNPPNRKAGAPQASRLRFRCRWPLATVAPPGERGTCLQEPQCSPL